MITLLMTVIINDITVVAHVNIISCVVLPVFNSTNKNVLNAKRGVSKLRMSTSYHWSLQTISWRIITMDFSRHWLM